MEKQPRVWVCEAKLLLFESRETNEHANKGLQEKKLKES